MKLEEELRKGKLKLYVDSSQLSKDIMEQMEAVLNPINIKYDIIHLRKSEVKNQHVHIPALLNIVGY